MARNKILADIASQDVTAAEFDRLDGIGSAAVGISDTQTLTNKTLGSGVIFPTGHVLQVQNYFTNAELSVSCAANQYTDLGTFQVSITPSSSSNKILVMLSLAGYNFSSTNYGIAGSGALRRKIASGSFASIGVGSGNTNFNGSFNMGQVNSYQYTAQVNKTFLDSPNTTSACTYGIAVADHNNSTQTFYLNRMGTTGDNPYSPCLSSSIIAMEVVA